MKQKKAAWLRKNFFLIVVWNWQTSFGSDHVPADLMNDNVGETYKNLSQRAFESGEIFGMYGQF